MAGSEQSSGHRTECTPSWRPYNEWSACSLLEIMPRRRVLLGKLCGGRLCGQALFCRGMPHPAGAHDQQAKQRADEQSHGRSVLPGQPAAMAASPNLIASVRMCAVT